MTRKKTKGANRHSMKRLVRHHVNDIIFAGPFRLHNYEPGKFWLSNREGEGMETSEEKIMKLLGGFFRREMRHRTTKADR